MRMANAGRKLAGTISLLVLLIVYSLLVMGFAASSLPAMGGWIAILFYIVAGTAWVPIAMALVSWMYRRDKPLPRP
jgi:NADH:ubiquinone oxidoreductase subunit K